MSELVDLAVPGRRTVEEWRGKSPDEPFPPRVRLRILLRFDRKCANCTRTIRGGEAWTCDHTIAIILGGENRESNGRPLCEICTPIKDASDQAAKSKDADVQKAHYGIKDARPSKLSKEYRREQLRRYRAHQKQ